ncbi:hypothetical protein [Gracilibacillus suaedae]|uniref:hypothetical protein n=1 Tax=Gracilibacillus suaedae TaxID=2820273 RepID=UPI001ABDD7F8|nr:hypothetical protein [Gracilibacillus suaedae]
MGIDWSGLSLPFDVGELITSGSGLLGFVGAFVLVGLAFVFIPLVIEMIFVSIRTFQDNKINKDSPRHKRRYSEAIYTNVFEDRIYSAKKRFRR